MRYLRPRIDRSEAEAALRRRRFALLRRRRSQPLSSLRTERVWLRYLLVQAPVVGQRWQSAACLVCTATGSAWTVELEAQRFVESDERVAGARLPRALLEEAGLRHLRGRAALAGRGAELPRLGEQIEVEEWALPYWVLFYDRGSGRLDFRALDAITGQPAGGSVRQALLASMLSE